MSEGNTNTPGRNAPCPCGSGKKYKRCCGALESASASTSTAPAGKREGTRIRFILSMGLVGVLAVLLWVEVSRSLPRPGAEQAASSAEAHEDGAYDEALNRHWHAEHGHWHPGPPPGQEHLANRRQPAPETAEPDAGPPTGDPLVTPEPWSYRATTHEHWHPGHGHWHPGPPPPPEAR